jgi:hypothetical protein
MMKRLILIFALPVFLSTACSKTTSLDDNPGGSSSAFEDNPNGGKGNNTTSIPAAVLSTFTSRYPNTTGIEWKKLSDGNYKVEFFRNGVRWQAIFSASGILIKEERG